MASYPPQQFSNTDMAQAFDIAAQTKFATVVHAGDQGLVTCHLPLTPMASTPECGTFVGHIVRNNPLYDVLSDGGVEARLIFQPAQGYVSPGVYGEKAETGKVVPTWNYVAAHFDGVLTLAQDARALTDILRQQTGDYESATGGSWSLDDAPSDYIASLSKAIAGVLFEVKSCLCIQKLSQNKPRDIGGITD